MADPNFIVRLTEFAQNTWPHMKIGHSVGAGYDRYPCANLEPVDNCDCPEEDPLCNCPCQELKPEEPEPTEEEMQEALEAIKECDNIKSKLGEEYLGCIWGNQNHPSSCCTEEDPETGESVGSPCVGEKFKEYVEYNRTNSTYWDTPPNTPLMRNAQMMLINAQKSTIVVNGDYSLKPGIIISLRGPEPEHGNEEKRFLGRWLVVGVEHIVSGQGHRTIMVLSRDSLTRNINESEGNWWDTFIDIIGGLF